MYTKIETPIYNLHIIKTDKFKRNVIKINFKNKLDKESIPKRRLIPNILFLSNKIYPGKRLLNIEMENLYNLEISGTTTYSGSTYITSFEATFLGEKYVSGLFEDALKFITDIIFKPDIKNNSFDESSFKKSCVSLKEAIDNLLDDPYSYAMEEVYKNIDSNGILSYPIYGTKKQIDKLTSSDIYNYYLDMLDNDTIDIFIIGDINPDTKLIDKYFNHLKPRKNTIDHYVEYNNFNTKYKEIKTTKNYNQSKLILAYKTTSLTPFEKKYVMPIYTYILGGGPDSKLFKTVREKNSLCYSISCNFKAVENLMFIKSGIDSGNYNKAVKLIKEEISNMENGNFTTKDIDKAKITYLSAFDEASDSIYSILNDYIAREYLNTDLIDIKKEEIEKVTKKDIMAIIPKIHPELIYLLEGSKLDD